MSKPKIIIVDDNDVPIGLMNREEIDPTKDNYRCAGIWVTNAKGEVLIAQRKFTKHVDPGKWGPAAAGTVDEGETYESNAHKELEEELGITDVTFTLGPKRFVTSPRRYFVQYFICEIDKPVTDFIIQEDEVEKIEWISKAVLLQDLKDHPEKYLPHFSESVSLVIS
ncbi:MAG: NUDIX domain-containing protein [Patescibacteria group bacterium]